ncbi:MAG: hypothetical protein HRT99_02885 [Mycoplasmatales bacterium]|nr:hypothetical protein [Mycoplasmatales bacterium]
MKRKYRIIFTALPIFISIATIGTYFGIQFLNQKEESSHLDLEINDSGNKTDNENSNFSKFKIFPELNENQFYKYIVIESGEPVLNDNFISSVINYVIKKIQISDGHVEWAYKYADDKKQSVSISFKWVAKMQKKNYSRTYIFKILKSV